MRRIAATAAVCAWLASPHAEAQSEELFDQTRALTQEIMTNGTAHADLGELTAIGPRPNGSARAEQAIRWAKAKLEAYGFENVTLQPTTTVVWTRGETERATLTDGADSVPLAVTALGGAVGTGAGGVEAQVVEVQSLAEVELRAAEVRGKIVFFNRPMDPTLEDTFHAYAGAIDQRSAGASAVARHGAVAAIVRSLTPQPDDDHPHTGALSYAADAAKIPAAAISTHGANELSRRVAANPQAKLRLELSAESHGMGTTYNVYGEIAGSELPNEVVVVGGHLDSWDLGVGAHDDGAGVVQSIETLRAIKALGLRPKRTIRVVLFMTEEIGGYGARTYAGAARADGTRHVAAIESDRGGFAPTGFSADDDPALLAKLEAWAPYLAPLNATRFVGEGSGADVSHLRALGAATLELVPDWTHYFDYHHAATDQYAAVVRDDLHAGAAAIATLAWLFAQE
jgi:Zn-dependent M28 family amino/carboxypeptidase